MAKRSLIDQLDQAITAMLAGDGGVQPDVAPEIAPLARIAAELRHLSRESFREHLQTDLERSTPMATMTEPVATTRIIAAPRLTFKDAAKAIEFYKRAFGAKEVMRFVVDGKIAHAEIMIGDSLIMLAEEWPEGNRYSAETLGNSPVILALRVPDVDEFTERALTAGAKVERPISDQFYGRREGTVLDPFGYQWSVSTVKEEMTVDEMYRRFHAMKLPSVAPTVSPVRKGYRTLTPYPVVQDLDQMIAFLTKTFGAEEKFRAVGSAGGYHCEVRVGDSMMMIGGGAPSLAWRGDSIPMAFHIYVPDCDAAYQRALQAGATSIDGPVDQSYGERSATVKDPGGNFWYIATHKGDSYKWAGAPDIQPYMHPLRAEPVINFLKRAFGAEELGRHATPDGVIQHATLKIGDSHLEMGEAHGPYQPMPAMFYLYVPDCDALYRRALAAGATSIAEPTDHPYGDRSGGVKDAFGNQWYIATHIKDVTA